jgi:transposase-like protein
VTNKIIPFIIEWQNRPLQSVYAIVLLDAIPFKLKQDWAIVNKATYPIAMIGNAKKEWLNNIFISGRRYGESVK